MTADKPISTALMAVAAITGMLLLVPLVAMQFTSEVDWDLRDFIIMGVLLMATGTAYVIGARLVKTRPQRWLVAALVGLSFFVIWAELAVGLIGTRFAGS